MGSGTEKNLLIALQDLNKYRYHLENEINNFISKPFWTVSAETNKRFFGKYYNDSIFCNIIL